jgi:hypothetical protein
MLTTKAEIPSFLESFTSGTITFNNQFESAPTLNYSVVFDRKKEKIINLAKFTKGVQEFTAYGYVFILNNSNYVEDPLKGIVFIDASFIAIRKAGGYISSKKKEEEDTNPFEVTKIGFGSAKMQTVVDLTINYVKDESRNWEFTPTILKWGTAKYKDKNDGNPITNRPIYEQIPQPIYIYTNDPEDAENAPRTGNIKDFTMNYDNSGPTKTKEINTYAGTRLIKKEVFVYGYVYTSDTVSTFVEDAENKRVPNFNGSFFSNYWRQVEFYTITFNYDESGYYLGYDKRGAKRVRYAAESDFEVLRLQDEGDPISANAFKFFWTPIIEYERLELHAYYKYYPDVKPTVDDVYKYYEKWNKVSKKYTWGYVTNKEYVIPRFLKKQLTYSRCYAFTYLDQDHFLNDTGEITKFISTGQESAQSTVVNILEKSIGKGQEDLEVYETITESVSTQDDSFKNYIKETSTSSSFGRPPQADYYNVYREKIEENLDNAEPVLNEDKLWYVKKIGDLVRIQDPDAIINTVEYPDINDRNEAFKQLKFDLQKSMLFNGDQFTVKGLYTPNVKPNNKIVVSYGKTFAAGIVKSVEHQIEIVAKGVAVGYTTVVAAIENNKNSMWRKLILTSDSLDKKPIPALSQFSDTLGDASDALSLIRSSPGRGIV